MTHRRGAIWTERMLLGLILVSLAGTLNLLVAIHRRALTDRRQVISETASVAKSAAPAPSPEPRAPDPAPPEIAADAPKSEPPPPPVEDPTQKALVALAAAKAKEIEAALAIDQRTGAMEAAYRSAAAESGRWKRREMLVRQQIAGITADAEKLERDADALDAERDVLERERDATKAALAAASKRSGFSVLPYKGPNGTWRRPIVIECSRGGAKLQPHGPRFTVLDLSPRILPRSSVFVKAVALELFHIRSADTPDGTPAVPYIVFLVRPDGVGPYYLARTCLEPLGIAFGYELVEQNLDINIPDYDNLATWDGTMPLDMPLEPSPAIGSSSRRLAQANQAHEQPRTGLPGLPQGDQGSMIGAADGADRGNRQGGQGTGSAGTPGPEDFVWPGRGRGASQAGGRSSGGFGDPVPGSAVAGGDSAVPSQDRGAGGNGTDGGVPALGKLNGQELTKTGDGPLLGSPGSSKTGTAGDELAGSGREFAAASGGRGFGDQPRGSSSGMTQSAANAEDVGTGSGSGADLADQPFPGTGTGTGRGGALENSPTGGANGTGSSVNGAGGGYAGSDPIFQLPTFEPAGDQAGSAASLGQPGLLSGRGSQAGAAAGVQAPAFGLGQTVKGLATSGGDDALAGTGGAFLQSSGAMPGGAGSAGIIAPGSSRGSQASGGNPGSGNSGFGVGSGAQTTDEKAASDAATGTNTTGMGGQGKGQGPGRGFDWTEAAKDNPSPGAADSPAPDPAQGAELSGMASDPPSPAAAARANAAGGGALNRLSLPANAPQGLQAYADQAGQYTQADIDRAQSLSGLSKFVSPGLAQKLSGLVPASGSASSMTSSSTSSDTTSDTQSGGMPSSTSSSSTSSNNQSGGMPLGGNTQSSLSSPSSSSTNSFGLNTSPSSDEANNLIMPPRPKPALPAGAIDAPFQIVVVCRKDEVVLHPGSYRLTGDVLRSPGQGTDCMLAREIRAMVRNRAMVDPLIRQKPALRFLVESQGAETFALARRQLLFSLPDWPVSLQVSGSQDLGVFSRNPW